MKVLVAGAAGYIGSVVAEQLVEQEYEVVALDNPRCGHRAAVHPKALLRILWTLWCIWRRKH
jgi:UDP-glucose 4-epimerase